MKKFIVYAMFAITYFVTTIQIAFMEMDAIGTITGWTFAPTLVVVAVAAINQFLLCVADCFSSDEPGDQNEDGNEI